MLFTLYKNRHKHKNFQVDFTYFDFITNEINKKYKLDFYNIENSLYNDDLDDVTRTKLQFILDSLKDTIDLIIYQENDNDNKIQEQDKDKEDNEIDFYIKSRKHRAFIKDSLKIRKFLIGDILEFVYNYKNMALTFSGICISLKKKTFVMPDLSLILRNVIIGTGIEVTLSYFYNRGYKMQFLDYRRKFYFFNKNKLYFIRDRVNRESKV